MVKIGFFEAEGWEKEILEKELKDVEIHFTCDRLKKEKIGDFKNVEILSVFVSSLVGKEIIDALPNLKLIATRSTGFDHIDINCCKERGIVVCNVPEYGTKTVAEWTIGLMLNSMRRIYYAIDQIKEVESFDLSNLRGEELFEKTLGVIGTGRIGKEVIKLAKALGMKVLAYDPYPDEDFAKEQGIQYTSLEEILKNSDVISIHANLNPSSYHLINKKNINLIKRGAYLINTARGGIVETEAIVYALKERILKGAALDVLEGEREIKEELEILAKPSLKTEEIKTLWQNHILMKMPNVLITPHTAFNSKEAIQRILKTTIENIKAFLAGNPINKVA